MTKRKFTLLRLSATLIVVMMMVLSLARPTFAENNFNSDEAISGTENEPAEAVITKILKMGEGTSTPDIRFGFEFTAKSVDGKTSGTDFDSMPNIGPVEIEFHESDLGKTEDGVKTVIIESESLFSGKTFNHAGVYIYEVEETKSVNPGLSAKESISYSNAKYEISVYVANGSRGVYVAAIGAKILVSDGYPGTQPGDKVDGRPGGVANDGDYSKITFTNTYQKITGTGYPEDYILAIGKTVDSPTSDPFDFANRELYFDFQITVTKSNSNKEVNQKYRAYILNERSSVVTSELNYSGNILNDETYGDYIEFSTGDQLTISLKHGQWVSFVDLEIGATYKVTEIGTSDFIPRCDQTIKGNTSSLPGELNSNLVVASTGITEGDDRADFVNTYKTVTPTGISVDDLPYYVLVAITTIAFVAYIVVKTRKAKAN